MQSKISLKWNCENYQIIKFYIGNWCKKMVHDITDFPEFTELHFKHDIYDIFF